MSDPARRRGPLALGIIDPVRGPQQLGDLRQFQGTVGKFAGGAPVLQGLLQARSALGSWRRQFDGLGAEPGSQIPQAKLPQGHDQTRHDFHSFHCFHCFHKS